MTGRDLTPDALARMFHETYERLAPSFGYRTREASAKPWDEVPEGNRALMTATCAEVLAVAVPLVRAKVAEQIARAIEGSCECATEVDPLLIRDCPKREDAAIAREYAKEDGDGRDR